MSGNPMQRWPVWYITAGKWMIRYLFSIILKCTVLWSGAGEEKLITANTSNFSLIFSWIHLSTKVLSCLRLNTVCLRDHGKATKTTILFCTMRNQTLNSSAFSSLSTYEMSFIRLLFLSNDYHKAKVLSTTIALDKSSKWLHSTYTIQYIALIPEKLRCCVKNKTECDHFTFSQYKDYSSLPPQLHWFL